MSVIHSSPSPFTADDYRARMERVVADAIEAGLDGGVLVTPGPGPGLAHRATSRPPSPSGSPCSCSRPGQRADAVGAAAGTARCRGGRRAPPALTIADWTRRRPTPTRSAAPPAGPGWALRASPTPPGRCTCSACRSCCPGTCVPAPDRLPADAAGGQGRPRAGPAGGGRRRRRRHLRRDPHASASPATRDRGRRRPRRAAAPVRARAGRLHRGRVRPQRRQPAPRGRRAGHPGGRRRGPRLRRAHARLRLRHHPDGQRRRAHRTRSVAVHDIVRQAQQAAFEAVAARRAPVRRSTGSPAQSSPQAGTASTSSTAPATASA